jgi:hypothetical protein
MQPINPVQDNQTLLPLVQSERRPEVDWFNFLRPEHVLLCDDGSANLFLVIPSIPAPDNQGELTPEEQKDWDRYREVLKEHEPGFREFLAALDEIKSKGLFRQNHSTFARYAFANWSFRPASLAELADVPEDLAKIWVPRGRKGGAQ